MILNSSANPKKLSMTVKSILTLTVGFVIGVTKHFGVDIDAGLLDNIVNIITDIVMFAALTIGAAQALFGVLRKVYFDLKS